MSDQPNTAPNDDAPNGRHLESSPKSRERSAQGNADEDAPESSEVQRMEEAAIESGSQPRGKTAKIISWVILIGLGLCLIGILVVVLAKSRH